VTVAGENVGMFGFEIYLLYIVALGCFLDAVRTSLVTELNWLLVLCL
jgi:hypothetical protein